MLATFTCSTSDGNMLRGLKDCGSRSNLVTRGILTATNHRVIDQVKLDLSGINESKMYRTQLVEMTIKLGDQYRCIEVIVLPSIQIDLILPDLSRVVRDFESKGYKLADEKLLKYENSIRNIDLLLGTDASYCFIDRMIPFGKDLKSTFSYSNLGVMLYGRIGQVTLVIEYLPPYSDLKVQEFTIKFKSTINLSSVKINCKLSSCNMVGGANFQLDSSPPDIIPDSKNFVDKALSQTLESECCYHLHKNDEGVEYEDSELNSMLIKHLIENTTRASDGQPIIPLMWNGRYSHLLANNERLAKSVLESNKKKLVRDGHISLVDDVIREQVSMGFIKRIDDVDKYLEVHPDGSFLAHMPIVKL